MMSVDNIRLDLPVILDKVMFHIRIVVFGTYRIIHQHDIEKDAVNFEAQIDVVAETDFVALSRLEGFAGQDVHIMSALAHLRSKTEGIHLRAPRVLGQK
jgi:hypothetical protein